MKRIHCMDKPVEIDGLAPGYHVGHFWKMPEHMLGKVNDWVTIMCPRSTGGRIRFRTDAAELKIRVALKTLGLDQNFPIKGSAGCDVLIGNGEEARFAGLVTPVDLTSMVNEATIQKAAVMEDVTIYLPRNEEVEDVEIFLPEAAAMEAPTPYRWEKPIVFYGSSITEGCTACRPSNAYTALTARWLHADFRNLGFSGAARGETSMAEFIAGLDMCAFVMDYDENAPSAAHLRATHEPFFQIIRKAQPDLPILMLSAPHFEYIPEAEERRRIIRATWENARAAGDNNVYFIDGETLFEGRDRTICTIDRVHPNDTGMFRMADKVSVLLDGVLR